MPRILAIDYGLKRTGLAVTDPLKIIANGLTTVDSKELIPYLKKYFQQEQVELILIGEPKNLDDSDTHGTPLVRQCIETPKLIPFLKDYFKKEAVELIIIGEPKNWDESDTHATPLVRQAIVRLQKEFPAIPLKTVDERFTSKMASRAMIDMGMKKKQRQNKALVDEIAATIMLQEYLQFTSF